MCKIILELLGEEETVIPVGECKLIVEGKDEFLNFKATPTVVL